MKMKNSWHAPEVQAVGEPAQRRRVVPGRPGEREHETRDQDHQERREGEHTEDVDPRRDVCGLPIRQQLVRRKLRHPRPAQPGRPHGRHVGPSSRGLHGRPRSRSSLVPVLRERNHDGQHEQHDHHQDHDEVRHEIDSHPTPRTQRHHPNQPTRSPSPREPPPGRGHPDVSRFTITIAPQPTPIRRLGRRDRPTRRHDAARERVQEVAAGNRSRTRTAAAPYRCRRPPAPSEPLHRLTCSDGTWRPSVPLRSFRPRTPRVPLWATRCALPTGTQWARRPRTSAPGVVPSGGHRVRGRRRDRVPAAMRSPGSGVTVSATESPRNRQTCPRRGPVTVGGLRARGRIGARPSRCSTRSTSRPPAPCRWSCRCPR